MLKKRHRKELWSWSRSRGVDRGQTGLLLAALLTPIKTGRHFIALAYQISWHSGINKASNKYDPLTSPCHPKRTKVTSPDQPQAFSFSYFCSCSFSLPHSWVPWKCQLFCKFQRQVFARLLFASFSLLLLMLLHLLLLVAFLCDFVFCHKLRWSTSPATCRCKDAPQCAALLPEILTLCFPLFLFTLPLSSCHVPRQFMAVLLKLL